ncbi:MAG: FHA domain-containing protein [Thermoanaerobaculia bacterium]
MRVSFGRFVFDSDCRELLAAGVPAHLPPKAFRLLELLIEAAPRAIAKKELLDAVWPDTYVEESNLAGLVNEVRAALGDTPKNSQFVRTIHGYGYAFCGSATAAEPRAMASVVFRGNAHSLRPGVNVLGRDPAADIEIDDRTVSRRHAQIVVDGSAAQLVDLESKNGTFLDGRQVSAQEELRDGASITLGDAMLLFRFGSGTTTVTRVRARSSRPR